MNVITLRDQKINHCVGCFHCWYKTPGICVYKDDGAHLLSEYMKSDFAVFATPVMMGFISPLLKNVNERMFAPIVLPFLEFDNGKMQHIMRYHKYPSSCLLLGGVEGFNKERKKMIHDIYKSARHRKLCFTEIIGNNLKEISDEINNF